jgi:hypothetical protein
VTRGKRNRPVTSFTLPFDVVAMIDELAQLAGWSRTRCVEECVRYAYPALKKRLQGVKARREAEEGEGGGDEEERLREEYWRRVYLGQLRRDEWEPEWWAV